MKLRCKFGLARTACALVTSAISLCVLNCASAQQFSDAGMPDGRSGLTYQFSDPIPKAQVNPKAMEIAPPQQSLNFSDQSMAVATPNTTMQPVFQPPYARGVVYEAQEMPMQMTGAQATIDPFKNDIRRSQAGHPYELSKRAKLTYTEKYQGYFVGGGVPTGRRQSKQRGEPRFSNEGTWGMDYAPFYSRVASNWSHGKLFQGGIGQYEPDHKNRPFGQTFGKRFGNKDRRFETEPTPHESR